MQLNTRKTNNPIKTMDERHKHSSKEEEFHTHTLIKISCLSLSDLLHSVNRL